ncbi:MAG: universal stress protein [Anaerolineae bacterium]
MYKRVLVPLDGSGRAEAILPHVEALAKAYDSTIVLLRVIEPVSVVVGPHGMDGHMYLEQVHNMERDVREYLKAKQVSLQHAGFTVEILMMHGTPTEAILLAVGDENIDLVAMASHGRSGLGTVVFGSVASGVLHRLEIPMLLIRAWSS